ncbi:MAG: A/G-specific adenine glycosylase [Phycisphaerales bacterium]
MAKRSKPVSATDRAPAITRQDRAVTRALTRWFAGTRRDLPWRTAPGQPRDPYLVLVSETMLQQTQVSRVVEKFAAFMQRFPTVAALAAAEIDDVLALWSGLGYYRRARNLHAAARAVVERFGGEVPRAVDDLLSLPGVGRYTAGAIAAIAHRSPAPAVDGNIQRVILRLEGAALAPTSKQAQSLVWHRAEQLVRTATDPAEWTEGLMELGATVCTPKSPRCAACPLESHCEARRRGLQHDIPAPKPRRPPRDVYHTVALCRDRAGRVLLEQRPPTGMWAGLWQPPTIEREKGWAAHAELKSAVGASTLRTLVHFDFQTTHRTVRVRVCGLAGVRRPKRGAFIDTEALAALGVSNLTRRVLEY